MVKPTRKGYQPTGRKPGRPPKGGSAIAGSKAELVAEQTTEQYNQTKKELEARVKEINALHEVQSDLQDQLRKMTNRWENTQAELHRLDDELRMEGGKLIMERENMAGLMVLVRALASQENKYITLSLDLVPEMKRLLEQAQKEEANRDDDTPAF